MSRPIIATLFHKNQPVYTRHYARVTTAIPRSIAIILERGEPGDVVELAHGEWGFQIATIKVQVGASIKLQLSTELKVAA